MLKDDADWSTLGIKDGHTFMMMGSAAELPKGPVEKTVFVEDLAPSDVAMAEVKIEHIEREILTIYIVCWISSWIREFTKHMLYECYFTMFKKCS